MRSLGANLGILLCGLVTCLLAAGANFACEAWPQVDFFTLMMWGVAPAGAICFGAAGASGYYFGALFFNRKANKTLLAGMVVVAGATQVLIYWLGYVMAVRHSGQRLDEAVPFADYLRDELFHAHYELSQSRIDLGEVGRLGYGIALLQFIGFLGGGMWIWVALRNRPMCAPCGLYLRQMGKKKIKTYPDTSSAGFFVEQLAALPTNGAGFAALIRQPASIGRPKLGVTQPGATLVDTRLLGCPRCNAQSIRQTGQRFTGSSWKDDEELTRLIPVASGTDLGRLFRE